MGGEPLIELQPDLELTISEAERVLEDWLGEATPCRGVHPLEGGLVNSVFRLEFNRPPHRAVIKLHGSDSDTFAAEARSLQYLGSRTSCPVPQVYLQDSSARVIPNAFLLLEHVPGVRLDGLELDQGERAALDAQLAGVLIELHGHTESWWGGLGADDKPSSWADVFAPRLDESRSYPKVAELLPPDVLTQVDEAIGKAPQFLGDSTTPTLVHGDVWDGNLMVDLVDGRWRLTGLLDPDVQFADVELELAYLEVFDNKRDDFFAAYTSHRPLRDGYERRRLFYWLRTALIHVGLFGDEFFCEFTARTAERINGLEA